MKNAMTRPLIAAVPIGGVALAALAAGCVADPPDAPTWQADVQPILVSYCSRCHGFPADPAFGDSAPAGTLFASYGDLMSATGTIAGASGFAELIVQLADSGAMPPPLRQPRPTDDQIETLRRWAMQAAPRGNPRPGNRTPRVTVTEAARAAGVISFDVDVSDDDGDYVVGELSARRVGGSDDVIIDAIPTGRSKIRWIPSGLAPGDYALRARLDDGAGFTDIDAGRVTVGVSQ